MIRTRRTPASTGFGRSRPSRPRPGGGAPRRAGRERAMLAGLVLTATVLVGVDTRLGAESPVAGLRSTVATAVAPVQEAIGGLAEPVRRLAAGQAAAQQEREAELTAEIERLRTELRGAATAQRRAAELDALLALVATAQLTTVPARVVAVSPAQLGERTMTIDAGTVDGVEPDLTVVNGSGLVGRVLTATAHSATVQLVVDRRAQVGVRLADSAELGLARGGQVGAQDTLAFELLDPLAALAHGAAVVTFGSPGGRPYAPGIPVGVLRDVSGGYGATSRTAVLDPYVDFTALDLVGVVVDSPRSGPRAAIAPSQPAEPG